MLTHTAFDDLVPVKELVTWFRNGTNRMRVLRDAQLTHPPTPCVGSTTPHTTLELIAWNETRWNSEFNMLQRFIQLRAALKAAFHHIATSKEEKMPKDLRLPTDEEWTRLTALTRVLDLFLQTTKTLEGDGLTIVLVPGALHALLTDLTQIVDSGSKYERLFALAFAKELQTRLDRHEIFSQPNCALLAAALHPRHSTLPMCSDSVRDEVWAELERRADTMCKKDAADSGIFVNMTPSPGSYVRAVRSHFRKQQDVGPDGPAGVEFAVSFWRSQFRSDPTLRPLLCAVWCVPASSAGAERLFSSLGQLHTTNQEIDTLYSMAVLRDWSRTKDYKLRALVDRIAAHASEAPDVVQVV